jgi:hypothetical protein
MSGNAAPDWTEIILPARDKSGAGAVWADIFAALQGVAESTASPVVLHDATIEPDRLLAEVAWELWQAYPDYAEKTSDALKQWAGQAPVSGGKAVLILDALSLRELAYILGGAQTRGCSPSLVKITGAECPSTTTCFAANLGLPSRSVLEHDGKPKSFALFGSECHTDVLRLPFEDCPVPPAPNIVFWHTWLDDLLHVQKKAPDLVDKLACDAFQSDGFWHFMNKLRQGRSLVITSDHGYATSKRFSSEVHWPDDIALLRDVLGASRYTEAVAPLARKFMPPIVLEYGGYHVVMGQWKWKVPGGFPQVCHGGLSLLEVAVPWVEFAAI